MKKTRQERRRAAAEQRKESRAAVGRQRSSGSRRRERALSQSPDLPADKLALLGSLDSFAGVRDGLRRIAADKDEWAGIPMPLQGEELVVEPNHPLAIPLSVVGAPEPEALPDGVKLRNRWYSVKMRADVYVYEEDGKILGARLPRWNTVGMELHTLGCSVAWGIEQEGRAVALLGTLLSHYQFKCYLLTGMFLETSKRSGLTYLFRKLRPTVVLNARDKESSDPARVLAALCLHPIAYYQGTWAGAMTPTDDVVAHLMLMRGDEPMLWRRANQHAPGTPEAAI